MPTRTVCPEPGGQLPVYANSGERPARVLAVRGSQALVEYRMPAGTTALRLLTYSTPGHQETWWRPVPYSSLSLAWLQAVVDAGQSWIGAPQQHRSRGVRVPTPEVMLCQRRFERAFRGFWVGERAVACLAAICAHPDFWNVTGWDKGACGIAALGILGWIRASPAYATRTCPAVQVRLLAVAGVGHRAAHVFVSVAVGRRELCLDPSGFWTRRALRRRWEVRYGLAGARVAPLGEDAFTFRYVRVPYRAPCSASIGEALREALGVFPLSLFFPRARHARPPRDGPLRTHRSGHPPRFGDT